MPEWESPIVRSAEGRFTSLYDGVVPYEDLELLRRAYVENEPFRTIADDMGISLGAAKIRASRTKHRLKQEIRKHF